MDGNTKHGDASQKAILVRALVNAPYDDEQLKYSRAKTNG